LPSQPDRTAASPKAAVHPALLSSGPSARGPRGTAVRIRQNAVLYAFVAPASVFLLALLVYPIAFNIVTSFQSLTTSTLLSGEAPWVGVDNYASVLADESFLTAVVNSVVFTGASVVGHLLLGTVLALYFWRRFRGNGPMRSMFLIAYAIPIVVAAQVFRWLFDGQSGFISFLVEQVPSVEGPIYWLSDPALAMIAVIGVNLWIGTPFTMTAVTSALANIPVELHEAARIDGANSWQGFRFVTWPLIRPTVLAVTILGVIFTFKMFDLIWIMTRSGPANTTDILPTLAYRLVFVQFEFGRGAAILNLVFLVLFALSIAYLVAARREESAE
jgi:multiple sugar transport system permease protein